MTEWSERNVARSDELVRMIAPYFLGESPDVVFATLVDLSARWVLAHCAADEHGNVSESVTLATQQHMLAEFVKGVATLVMQGKPPPVGPVRRDA